jgi:prefoldin subunit 5
MKFSERYDVASIVKAVIPVILVVVFIVVWVRISSRVGANTEAISTLNSQTESLQGQLSSLQTQFSSLQSQLSSINSTITALSEQEDALSSQITALQEERSSLTSLISESESQLSSLSSELESLQSSVDSLSKRVASLSSKLGESTLLFTLTFSQGPGVQTTVYTFTPTYAGSIYISGSSSSSTGYVMVNNNTSGTSKTYAFGTGKTVTAPLTAGNSYSVYFGNHDSSGTVTATLTGTYLSS